MLKTLVLRLSLSPREAVRDLARHLLPVKEPEQMERVVELTAKAPLILQVETTNVCNARCAFCAYPGMKRPKGIMDEALFEKIIVDYVEMGGGAVSLTPIMGDPLLDPHLLHRVRFLREQTNIGQIAMTTNAIALHKYSDEEIIFLLNALAVLQLSIGGLDAETYRQMYGLDKFVQVRRAMDRLMALNEQVDNPADLAFGFRTNDWKFELRHKRQLDAFRRRGVHITHLWTYGNYGGLVESNRLLGVEVNQGPAQKIRRCALPCVHLAVCWDGTVTACGCADAEGSLALGHADRDSLAEIWHGSKRAGVMESFLNGKPPKVCTACSTYQQDLILSGLGIENSRPHQPLPMDFYRKFWGA